MQGPSWIAVLGFICVVSFDSQAKELYYDDINRAHEQAHRDNEQVRLHSRFTNCAGFKLPSGEVFDMPEPKLTLDHLISTLPSSLRGPLFDYYFLTMGKHWQTKPSYVWDEWVGYLSGAKKKLELKMLGQSARSTLPELKEFTLYGIHLHSFQKAASSKLHLSAVLPEPKR
jgi:hypothetical protein